MAYVFEIAPGLPPSTGMHLFGSPAARRTAGSLTKATGNADVFPPAGKKFIGIMTSAGPYNFADLDAFTKAVGHQPEVYEFSQGWRVNEFNRGIIERVVRRGMMPMISWEPWNYLLQPKINSLRGFQSAYRLSRIIDGDYDQYIKSWAEGIKALGFPIAIRFAHEMNGTWYPWCERTNGNRPGQYVRAWRHVHDIFSEVGATNVTWVWSPNIIYDSASANLRELYPGNNYVNWIGLSGYYGPKGRRYKSFDRVFGHTISFLRTFTNKPVVVTEVGATDDRGLEAKWVKQMFTELPNQKSLIGIIWFEAVKDVDWRIASDSAAVSFFAAGFAEHLYQMKWKPSLKLRSEIAR
jgi:beta-mannanase